MEYANTLWNLDTYAQLEAELQACADEGYREFHSRIVPGIGPFMGVRTPVLRRIAKEIAKGDAKGFLEVAKTDWYETTLLKGAVLALIKLPYPEFLERVDNFVTIIDNWAVCDFFCTSLKQIKTYQAPFFSHLHSYFLSHNPWIVRAGLVIALSYYLEEPYVDAVLEACAGIQTDHYYVKMAQAWLLSIAYIKAPEKTLPYLETQRLDAWTHNKAIQKIRESYRVPKEDKDRLNRLKVPSVKNVSARKP